jgi:hypothetical protein
MRPHTGRTQTHASKRENTTIIGTSFLMTNAPTHGESVIINVSPGNSLLPNRKFKGEIEEFADKHLVLLSDEEIDVSAGITAQGKDLLFMGHVLNCSPGLNARWAVHVSVNRTLLVV